MDTWYIPRPQFEEPFLQMLESRLEPRILNLYSTIGGEPKGGMGKTRLLQRYGELCKERSIRHTEILDFRLTMNCSRTAILMHIVNLDPDSFPEYLKKRKEYVEKQARMPRGGTETALAGLEREMDETWLREFGAMLKKGKLGVFLDTWEAIAGTELEEWWRRMLLSLRTAWPDGYKNLVLVIAGRPPVSWDEPPVQRIEVGPFTLEETTQYAQSRGYMESGKPIPGLVQAVHEASGGHPVLVAWAFDYGDRGIDIENVAEGCKGDVAAFRRRLVEETHPELDPTLAWSACLYRRFDVRILRYITGWDEDKCKEKIQQLQRDWPSIVRRGADEDSCEPHDAARELLIEHAWPMIDPSGSEWRRLRRLAIAYYDSELRTSPADAITRGKHHAYMAERLCYWLADCEKESDPQSCFGQVFQRHFLPDLNHALSSYQLGLARSLLREVSPFVKSFSDQLQDEYDICRAHLLMRDQKFTDALQIYNDVKSRAEKRGDNRVVAEVQTQMGRLYYLQGDFASAQQAYEHAINAYQTCSDLLGHADALRYLGTTYMSSGDWKTALDVYKKSMKEASQALTQARDSDEKREARNRLASAANQAAQAAVLLGDATQARGLARRALEIWESLDNKAGQAEAEMTLGRIAEMEGEFTFATMHLVEALNCYAKGDVPSPFGQARAKAFLARVRRRQEQFDEAERLIRESLEEFERLGRKTQQAFALSEWGTILRSKGYFADAEEKFNKALTTAREIKDKYREAEVLEDLALLALQRGNPPAQIEDRLQEAERVAEEGDYKLFLGRVKEHRGEMAFKKRDYEAAFSYYVRACHDLVQYHPDFYRRFINKVENRLFELPWDQIPSYADQVIRYWQDHGLDKAHPQLVQRMEAAKELANSLSGRGGKHG